MPYKIENGRLVETKQIPGRIGGYIIIAGGKSYAVLPDHLPIFEAMGTVEDGEFEVRNVFMKNNNEGIPIATSATIYAIPRKNEDVWEEAEKHWYADSFTASFAPQAFKVFHWLKQHYNLTRKK